MADVFSQSEFSETINRLKKKALKDNKTLSVFGIALIEFLVDEVNRLKGKIIRIEEDIEKIFDEDFKTLVVKSPEDAGSLCHRLGDLILETNQLKRRIKEIYDYANYIEDKFNDLFLTAETLKVKAKRSKE